ncbi:MAG: hypothetical protein FWC00_00550 [Firmicutes bacterium]|nr:hypothetical protein [Bacillota bacterium]
MDLYGEERDAFHKFYNDALSACASDESKILQSLVESLLEKSIASRMGFRYAIARRCVGKDSNSIPAQVDWDSFVHCARSVKGCELLLEHIGKLFGEDECYNAQRAYLIKKLQECMERRHVIGDDKEYRKSFKAYDFVTESTVRRDSVGYLNGKGYIIDEMLVELAKTKGLGDWSVTEEKGCGNSLKNGGKLSTTTNRMWMPIHKKL